MVVANALVPIAIVMEILFHCFPFEYGGRKKIEEKMGRGWEEKKLGWGRGLNLLI